MVKIFADLMVRYFLFFPARRCEISCLLVDLVAISVS